MAIRIVQLGSARRRGEGVRIGTVRRPPRGVQKSEVASLNYFDVWLPLLAPSQELLQSARRATADLEWQRFFRKYRAEMSDSAPARVLDLLAALSHGTAFAVGCYCEDERRCHRSVLRELLVARGAKLVATDARARPRTQR